MTAPCKLEPNVLVGTLIISSIAGVETKGRPYLAYRGTTTADSEKSPARAKGGARDCNIKA